MGAGLRTGDRSEGAGLRILHMRSPRAADRSKMKRLESFGFVPVSSQPTVEKRAKTSHHSTPAKESLPSNSGELSGAPPQSQPPQVTSQSDVVQPTRRNDLGAYSSDQLRSLSDEEKLWLLRNACRPDTCYKYPLRGHREQDAGPDKNPGNFRALLDFRVDAGDSVLKDHFKSMPRNAQYISPQIQNDLISCTGEWIRKQILNEVKSAKFFSICADEAADSSNREQLPLILRFVDNSNSIREEFGDFIVCDTGTTGVAIADKILAAVGEYGLNPEYLRGQAYDGAGNMAGKYRGAAVSIQSTCPKAVYVHCAAHSLNLCIVAACGVQSVQNMMGTMVEICLFFSNSPKRQLEFEKHIQSIKGARAKKLAGMYKTRWVARIDALELFFDLYPAVVKTFEVISEGSSDGWNVDSRRAAESLLICITKFQFIISFIVTKECLHYTKGITTSLQKRAKDICQAYAEVSTVTSALQDVRKNIDTKHKWHDAAVNLGQKVNAPEPQLPRRCGVQQRSTTATPFRFLFLTSCYLIWSLDFRIFNRRPLMG